MEIRHLAERQAARLPASLRMVMRPQEWDAVIHQFQRRLLAASGQLQPPPAGPDAPPASGAPISPSSPPVHRADPVPPETTGPTVARPATPVTASATARTGAVPIHALAGVPTIAQLREATVFRLRETPSMIVEGADRAWQAAWRRVIDHGMPWQAQELVTLLWWPSASLGADEIPVRLRVDGALKIDPAWWLKQSAAQQNAWLLWAIGHRVFRHGTRHQHGTVSAARWKTAATLWLESWLSQRFAPMTERPWRRLRTPVDLKDVVAAIRCGQVAAESLAEDPRFETVEWYRHELLEWDAPSVPADYGAHLDRIRRWVPFTWWEALMPMVTELSREMQGLILDDLAVQHRPEVLATLLRPDGVWGQSTRFWPGQTLNTWWREAGPHLQDALHAARATRF